MSSENEKPQKKKFLGNYLEFVDSTRFFTTPFSWLYVIQALVFLVLPIAILFLGIGNNGIFQETVFENGKMETVLVGKFVFAFILILLGAIAAAIISFVVAWGGKKKENVNKITIELIIDSIADLHAVFIKAAAHFIAVFGFFTGLFALIFGSEMMDVVGLGFVAGGAAVLMIGSLLLGYGLVWFSRLYKFLFQKLWRIFVKVIVQIFKFVILHAIPVIYNFVAHIIRQLFDYFFILVQAVVDFIVNGLKVAIALVARLGRYLLAYARSPFKNKDYNDAKVTYNQ